MNITREQALKIVDILFPAYEVTGSVADGYKVSIDKVAPVLTTSVFPLPLAYARTKLNDLIRRQNTTDDFTKLLGIVEQVIMHVENLPKFPTVPFYPPYQNVPTVPMPTPFRPYIGDPPFGGTTICSSGTASSSQADGHAVEDSQYGSPYKPLINDDIPF